MAPPWAPPSSAEFLSWYLRGNIRCQDLAKHCEPSDASLDDILNWPDQTPHRSLQPSIEHTHTFIQWLFPLPEQSAVYHDAPVVDRQIFDQFRTNVKFRNQLLRAYDRMVRFYGFRPIDESLELTIAFEQPGDQVWVRNFHHNHQRITRIIRSLRLLGCEDHALAFWEAVHAVHARWPDRIGADSVNYWDKAMKRPLYMAPSAPTRDNGKGRDFLVEWEQMHNPNCKATKRLQHA